MKWLANIEDPRHPKAICRMMPRRGETRIEAWRRQEAWLAGKVIADPMPAHGCDARLLRLLGLVGIYEPAAADMIVPERAASA